ncbi:unnamed protein product [Dovyalis caffra]|uniref:Uncharacterized protein n=1 Tax=Dovyalis caffra TaxID=77055 RepID=A0AAV1R0L0_9ROSI|nr:unnamed protein product [Dovyalis caffra]
MGKIQRENDFTKQKLLFKTFAKNQASISQQQRPQPQRVWEKVGRAQNTVKFLSQPRDYLRMQNATCPKFDLPSLKTRSLHDLPLGNTLRNDGEIIQ